MGTLTFQAALGGSVNLLGPNTASNINFTLPSADGTSGQPLQTNGSGTLSFANLAIANGGTGATSFSANQIHYGSFSQNANFVFDGTNMGIGTSSPSSKLDVVSSASGTLNSRIYNSVTTGNSGAQLQLQTDAGNFYIFKQNSTNVNNSGAGGIGIYGDGAYPMAFYTNSSERMRINSSGNVGIGTSSPAANNRLTLSDVYSSKLTITGGSTQNGMLFNAVSTSSQYYMAGGVDLLVGSDKGFLIYDATNARAKFYVEDTTGETRTLATTFLSYYTGGSERMRIDSSGNLGIGTSSPSASAILDAQSTTKGVRMPNMTTTQKNAISSPAAGLMVFDTTLAKLCVYSGSAWQTVTSI